MDGSYYRHLKSVDSGEWWYSYKPLQSKPLRAAAGDGGIVSTDLRNCELCSDRSPGVSFSL